MTTQARRPRPLSPVWLAVLAALLLVQTGITQGEVRRFNPPLKAPAFELPGLDGGRHALEDFRGRPLLISVWASWCTPCKIFSGPQGRTLRLKPEIDDFIEKLSSFNYNDKKILNFEMETSGLYGLGKLMGHYCCSVSVIVANRVKQKFSKDSAAAVDKLIQSVLESISK
jgi:thiol-disulfide isomerase/thioredoxin